jgi:hypothetical protein
MNYYTFTVGWYIIITIQVISISTTGTATTKVD